MKNNHSDEENQNKVLSENAPVPNNENLENDEDTL